MAAMISSSSSEDYSDSEAGKNIKLEPSPRRSSHIPKATTSFPTPWRSSGVIKRKAWSTETSSSSEEETSREHTRKKRKTGAKKRVIKRKAWSTETSSSSEEETSRASRCSQCLRRLDDPELIHFIGDPNDALEEAEMLADKRLHLFEEREHGFENYDYLPQHRITCFSVYDTKGHLCPFDTGLVEKNIELFFSGVVKPIDDHDSSPEGGIKAKKLGPIHQWWIAPYDREKAVICFSTGFADYILMEPSDEYASIFSLMHEKIYLSKIVVEFLQTNTDATYEDLIERIETTVPPPGMTFCQCTEDSLLYHSQFIIDQVQSYDETRGDDEESLLLVPCIIYIIRLSGLTLGKRLAPRRQDINHLIKVQKTKAPTKATTTKLVHKVFASVFPEEKDKNGKENGDSGVESQRYVVRELKEEV
ncbi:DNA (cytosine-5)-methyltransferase 1-like [Petaurus breviceps papuanus]|uniref:DNA (cytosine-5)-methyltransferase 1-like n=1 Tax=Petaurus breviceps papuanus TaxID=3040969 RepID=UPI0036DF739D